MQKIYTIGHSTRSQEIFLELLKETGIGLLADVRTFPGSRRYPHFNRENLQELLAGKGIAYLHMPSLGGRRKPLPGSVNTAWKNDSFRGYADHMQSDEFRDGLEALKKYAREKTTAIMCSEAVWWKCHRSLISDRLKLDGWEVLHIMEKGKLQEHKFTSPASIVQGDLFYGG